jgi:hypothetical protein
MGALSLFQVAFVVLKLCGVIDWSWWWVLAPVWGEALLIAGIWLMLLALKRIEESIK